MKKWGEYKDDRKGCYPCLQPYEHKRVHMGLTIEG